MNIFADDSAAQVQRGLDMGVQFVTKLTHGVLPILIKNGPSLLINNGSLVAAIPGPYLAVYASSKAYLKVNPASCRQCRLISDTIVPLADIYQLSCN